LVDEARLDLVGSRHPVVEAAIDAGAFVANDVQLDAVARRLVVLTGPNMAGKSTVLRQIALAVILAHVGGYVPAERAVIGLCDRVFTRVGASDDLARGQSTFMAEMAETAAILHHATPRSVVLLDEIGRGTSTYDGLSIAWAVAEDLVDRVGCLGMFATHYHELCELADSRPGVVNQSVAVSEQGDRILFLRRLKEGGASRSYGIQCARLAGLPGPVVARARSLLKHFEKHAPRNERQQLSLFGAVPIAADEPEAAPDPLRDALAALDPDALSPREAHEALYRLRGLL
ncbi:MAG TPA: DNA mismatch repair protein MutS, partial [Myxococcota bacterium]|nr:DNA mismatch repair protein MutS [Myxococcota bacterium]